MMRTRWSHKTNMLLCMGLLLMLGGCSEDHEEGTEQRSTRELRLSLGSQHYDTRGLPASFEEYVHAEALAPITQIQTYLTYREDEVNGYLPCTFNYQQTTDPTPADTWVSRVTLKDGQYYLYGFMPKMEVEGGITITPYQDDFSKGAVLNFTDLNAVIPDDICVIVGAEGYGSANKSSIPDMATRLGQFDYHTNDGDKLFLLVDHLYAGIQFNMRLGDNYSKMRVIKIRSLKLTPKDGDNDVVETVNAKVTIVANTTQTDPISDVEFTISKTGTNPKPAAIYEGEKELKVTNQAFLACFCPSTNKKYVLETIYDVYDKKGNLIRKGETARNVITLNMDLNVGQLHTVNITVEPTYLYVLSDPDLDNPTFIVN